MDTRIKAVLDEEYRNDPLYPFYIIYFEDFIWDDKLKDYTKKESSKSCLFSPFLLCQLNHH